jgi:hypothetical protein
MRPKSSSTAGHRGSALILFTLMVPTLLIPLAGLGIDATICYIVQAKLGSAVDGAALGAGRLLGTTADPSVIANTLLAENFKADGTAGFWGATFNKNPTITFTPGITKTISIDAQVRVPLLFARVFGQSYAIVSAAGTAQRTDSRVVFVLDRSGSMNTDDKAGHSPVTYVIDDAIANAQSFVQNFTEGTDELGLVVFDGSGVVGYPTGVWSSAISLASTGGPNKTFNDGTVNDMPHQLALVNAGSGTGMADALSIAYIELQKAHMRDLATGPDTRLNSIVLLTDGVPSAITLFLNNTANSNADNAIKTTTSCTQRTSTTNKMIGWFAIPGPAYITTDFRGQGVYQIASTDPSTSHTSAWWMAHAGTNSSGSADGDAEDPNPNTPFAGCSGLTGSSSGTFNVSSSGTDIAKIPTQDYYGNLLNTTGYTNSHIVGWSGGTSIYTGSAIDLTLAGSGKDYNWGLAMWNAVDNAALSIRSDTNKPNRAGDTQTLSIYIYAIGYTGNGGTDDGLLKRVSNDLTSTSYNKNLPVGQYYQASDQVSLAQAFSNIASALLRLSK